MNRRVCPWVVSAVLASPLAAWVAIAILSPSLAGCDYSSDDRPLLPSEISSDPINSSPTNAGSPAPSLAGTTTPAADLDDRRAAILESVMNLIQTAALKPGGDNFKQATEKLNDYFDGTSAADYALTPATREFLKKQLPDIVLQGLERSVFSMPDARHLEDCMMYYGIANRIAGNGEDLVRVQRLFDWMVTQVQLVPTGSLGAGQLGQAQARPYDVLLRGMATEGSNGWSERGWLFMSLCRQLGIDCGILTYSPKGAKEPLTWACAVLIGKSLYLFDCRLGMPVPRRDGTGVATLEEVLSDPAVLAQLDLPGEAPYETSQSVLSASSTKIGVLLDSSPGYLSPRMRLLQNSLAGKNRTVLYRDPADQRDKFAEVLGPHSGAITLWALPITVETMLFTDPKFVEATQAALRLFDSRYPLLYARIKQLRGEVPEAIADYMKLRYAEGAMMMNGKQPIPLEVQEALDMTSTYFLALAHLEQNNPKQAAMFFAATLKLFPAPGPGQPYYNMFRWGAQANLGRLTEAKGNFASAIAYYTAPDQSPQHRGSLLRARSLIWRNPTAALPVLMPEPPSGNP